MEQREAVLDLPIIPENTVIAGKYVVEGRIAETDFSIIYTGINRDTEEKVVIKTPNETTINIAKDENNEVLENIIKQAFIKEGIILSNLDHQGIPKSYGHHFPILPNKRRINVRVMEYVPSHLDAFFKNKPFIRTVSEFIAQFAAILEYLQYNGIIHGDIKPQNIMCNRDEIKLIDFNIASQCVTELKDASPKDIFKLQDEHRSMTEAYASPEVKNGEVPVYASDIYSFGRVLEDLIIAYDKKDFSILGKHQRKTLIPGKDPSSIYDKNKVNIVQLMLDMPMDLVNIYSRCVNPNVKERIEPSELKYIARKLKEESKSPLYVNF